MSFQELSSRGRGSKDTLVTTESIKVYSLRARKETENHLCLKPLLETYQAK